MPDADETRAARSRESVSNTLTVAVTLSLVCSVLVASAAVLLKPLQQGNEERYRQRIILDVAGLVGADPEALFSRIEMRMVDLGRGTFSRPGEEESDDYLAAARDPDSGVSIPPDADIAGIRRRARQMPVYLVREDDAWSQVILPVYGAGLWSTMYGFLSLAADGSTVRALRFYRHAETPGLGDQIDEAAWRAGWVGKKIFDGDGELRIGVVRGVVADNSADAEHHIDGLAGATLTGRGVTNLVRYWTGPDAFGPFLENLAQGRIDE